jgi:hypothetical protein
MFEETKSALAALLAEELSNDRDFEVRNQQNQNRQKGDMAITLEGTRDRPNGEGEGSDYISRVRPARSSEKWLTDDEWAFVDQATEIVSPKGDTFRFSSASEKNGSTVLYLQAWEDRDE